MIMGRPREFDENRALEAATEQFWRAGYEATSLQDLLGAMHLSKSSLYQSFGNKHQLFLRCIDHYQHSMVNGLREKLQQGRSSRQFLREFLQSIILEAGEDNQQRKGCMLVNTANELSQRDELIAAAVSKGTGNMATVIRQAIKQGKQRKEIKTAESNKALVDYLMTAISGLRTMVKSGAKSSTLNSVVNLIMKTIE